MLPTPSYISSTHLYPSLNYVLSSPPTSSLRCKPCPSSPTHSYLSPTHSYPSMNSVLSAPPTSSPRYNPCLSSFTPSYLSPTYLYPGLNMSYQFLRYNPYPSSPGPLPPNSVPSTLKSYPNLNLSYQSYPPLPSIQPLSHSLRSSQLSSQFRADIIAME